MVSNFNDQIENFLNRNNYYREPLTKIINNMIDKCRYLNNESIERHNFGIKSIKLNNIPNNNEDELYKILENNDQKSIIELLWGDVQLGKRIHACIIMWISLYIYKLPVLYIFRNLKIDMLQLSNDIQGIDEFSFNSQFIKVFFEEYPNLKDDFKDFKLPNIRIIDDNIINNYDSLDAYGTKHIDCCLMNYKQLERINNKFNEYLYKNIELVNICIIVDESDLMAPTSSNDESCNTDYTDATKTEQLLAKIYKKCRYNLLITGTAHSLLYNVTTKISKNDSILVKISKVHKMIRTKEYYGLFNKKINFEFVDEWWSNLEEEIKYNIIDDYNKNIKSIINKLEESDSKYNSLLISEERIKNNHTDLSRHIMKDFKNLFIIIYNGDNLVIYIPKKYLKIIIKLAEEEERLKNEINNDNKKIDSEYNYYYFKINTKKYNIKQIYKLISILFNDYEINNRTCITITGKYGERGYSFVSDDYNRYSFHLTDQYYVSHSSYNCTTISQKLRLQGKYNDDELKKSTMKLTLWTIPKLKEILDDFFIKFIEKVEKKIMDCINWNEIKNLVEDNLNEDSTFIKNINYLDTSKKMKNIKKNNNKNIKPIITELTDNNNNREIINEIKELDIRDFMKEYGKNEKKYNKIKLIFDNNFFNLIDEFNNKVNNKGKPKKNEDKYKNKDFIKIRDYFIKNIYNLMKICSIENYYNRDKFDKNIYDWIKKIKNKIFYDKISKKNYKIIIFDNKEEYNNYNNNYDEYKIESNIFYTHFDIKNNKKYILNLVYDTNNNLYLFIRYLYLNYNFDDKLNIDKSELKFSDYINPKKIPYKILNNKIKFSIVKPLYHNLPNEYNLYYETLDNKIFNFKKDNKQIKIITPNNPVIINNYSINVYI